MIEFFCSSNPDPDLAWIRSHPMISLAVAGLAAAPLALVVRPSPLRASSPHRGSIPDHQ
ncbi:hypothetical protein K440DRAFT_610170 [Wilcoxina mikolae CBS 423.85]|nr:hypothetical protein K440DRAFT_610170 [Wilcoxina mikolae CBS 423.85]